MTYSKFIRTAVLWVATAIIVVAVCMAGFILLDWYGNAGWGYPKWSLLADVGVIAVGVTVRQIAQAALRAS